MNCVHKENRSIVDSLGKSKAEKIRIWLVGGYVIEDFDSYYTSNKTDGKIR
ncbi:hypothetical protein [Gracilibacillus sp. Marseille-QA3620]